MGKTELTFISIIIFLIGILAYATYVDGRKWQEYKAEHKCRAVAYIRFPPTAEKTGWLCDDGVTYYR